MPRFVDLTGKSFGRWGVIRRAPPPENAAPSVKTRTFYLCRCACGAEKVVQGNSLVNGTSLSCHCSKAKSFDPGAETITCPGCGQTLPATKEFFSRTSKYRTGFFCHCKKCLYRRGKARQQRGRRRLKILVMTAYAGDPPACACCGVTYLEFLTIDHVNGDGAEHRKTVPAGKLYQWLKANGFPPNFQVLCYNCNCAFGRYGYCPHRPEVRRPLPALPSRPAARGSQEPPTGKVQ